MAQTCDNSSDPNSPCAVAKRPQCTPGYCFGQCCLCRVSTSLGLMGLQGPRASVDIFKAIFGLSESNLASSSMNEGLETPGFSPGEYIFGQTASPVKHKTSSVSLTTASLVVLDKSLSSHQFPH